MLDGWLKEKSELNTDCEMEFQNEAWHKESKRIAVKNDSYYDQVLRDSEITDRADAYARGIINV